MDLVYLNLPFRTNDPANLNFDLALFNIEMSDVIPLGAEMKVTQAQVAASRKAIRKPRMQNSAG